MIIKCIRPSSGLTIGMNLLCQLFLSLPILASASLLVKPTDNEDVSFVDGIIAPIAEALIIEALLDPVSPTESLKFVDAFEEADELSHSKMVIDPSNHSRPIVEEVAQINKTLGLLNIIEMIYTEALNRSDPKAFVTKFLTAILTLAEEANDSIIKEKHPGLFLFKKYEETLSSRPRPSSGSDSSFGSIEHFEDVGKFKMMKASLTESDLEAMDEKDSKEISVVEAEEALKAFEDRILEDVLKYESKEDEYEYLMSSSDEEKDGLRVTVTRDVSNVNKKKKGRGRGGRRTGGGALAVDLASAGLSMAANMNVTADEQGKANVEGSAELAALYPPTEQVFGMNASMAIDDAMMEKLQQQILAQVMGKLSEQSGLSAEQISQATNLIGGERAKLEAVLGGDLENLDKMNGKQVIDCLRTSAIPKLLNELIREKTNVDVLKTLSRALRVLNEGLASLEVILKMLIRVNKRVRYYVLFASDVVADMARPDNMIPVSDLSVSLKSNPTVARKTSKFKTFRKMFQSQSRGMFRKAVKATSSGYVQLDASLKEDPVTAGMRAALLKAQSYSNEFQKVPTLLLLRILHTIFTQLDDRRDGAIRAALTAKTSRTLSDMKKVLGVGVEMVYDAVRDFYTPLAETSVGDAASLDALNGLRPEIFVEILMELISTSEWDKTKLEEHIVKIIAYIKPLLYILDLNSQIDMLEFMLHDKQAEMGVFDVNEAASREENHFAV